LEAAATATRIAEAVEARGAAYRAAQPACRHDGAGAAVAHAAAAVATEDRDVVAITCYTETGRTARLLAAERPGVPVFAFIPDEEVRRANALLWGVTTLPARKPADTDEMIALMDEGLRSFGIAQPDETVVMAAASPAGKTTTNMLKIHRIGSPVR
jgi:pyruvate kinase